MVNPKKQARMKQSADRTEGPGEPDRDPSASEDRPERDVSASGGQPPRHPPEAGGDKKEWIRQQLRAAYDETLKEPIPERFLELLDQIDKNDPEPK